jgi:hypothetical protein
MVGILLTCGKHLHDPIVVVMGEDLAHSTSLIPTYFIEVPVAIQQKHVIYIYDIGYSA